MNNNENDENEKKIEKISNVNAFYNSMIMNYKSWLLIIITVSYLSYPNVLKGIIDVILLMMFVHIIHYMSHIKTTYPTNIIHLYHHSGHNFLTQFSQIILELFCGGLMFIIINTLNIDFIIDKWLVMYIFIFYVIVHDFNYSILHVNKTHEIHHHNQLTNIGPDVIDIIFGTKYDNNDIENTDHYIIPILISTIIVYFTRYNWENACFKKICILLFSLISIMFIILNVYLILTEYYKYDINTICEFFYK